MKIVFFGTPDYVLPVLESLHKSYRSRSGESPIAAVVTQAPKPVGRKQLLEYSPVDNWAYKKHVPIIFNPGDLINKRFHADIGVLASFGKIISEEVIKIFPFGIMNIHPSLLPAWRGSSPIQASIISGQIQTGVSIIKLDAKLDHGLIISQFKDEILENDTGDTLRRRLFQRSADVIPPLIDAFIAGKVTPKKQDDKTATFTRQIKTEDAYIPPEFLTAALAGAISVRKKWDIPFIKSYSIQPSALSIYNFIRAMQPWPISWSSIQLSSKNAGQSIKRLKIHKAHTEPANVHHPQSTDQKLILDVVQLEGKSAVGWKQFSEGYPKAKFAK